MCSRCERAVAGPCGAAVHGGIVGTCGAATGLRPCLTRWTRTHVARPGRSASLHSDRTLGEPTPWWRGHPPFLPGRSALLSGPDFTDIVRNSACPCATVCDVSHGVVLGPWRQMTPSYATHTRRQERGRLMCAHMTGPLLTWLTKAMRSRNAGVTAALAETEFNISHAHLKVRGHGLIHAVPERARR